MLRIASVLFRFVLPVLLCTGCDVYELASRRAQLTEDLERMGLCYHNYHEEHGCGPANWDELVAFRKSMTLGGAYLKGDLASFERLRYEEYQVNWGVQFHEVAPGDWSRPTKSMHEKMAATILARGGADDPVLMMGCTVVRSMSSLDAERGSLSGSADASVSYQPPFAPIVFSINSSGEVSLQAATSITTNIGSFALGAGYTLSPDQGYTHVIIRDRRRGAGGQETVYRVYSGDQPLSFVYDGTTRVTVQDRRVVIDVSDGVARDVKIDALVGNP